MRMPSTTAKIIFAVSLLLVFAFAVWLRLFTSGHCRAIYTTDSSFHARITAQVIDQGRIPQHDPSYLQTPPRNPAQMYPPNFYYLAAGIYRRLCAFGELNVSGFFFFHNAVWGGLPVLALAWLVWELSGRKWATVIAGLMMAVVAPCLQRSFFLIFRFESAGVFLVLAWAALLVRWRSTASRRGRLGLLGLTFAIFLSGAGFWRLFPVLATVLAAAVLIDDFLAGRPKKYLAPLWAAMAGTCTAWFLYDFYRLGGADHALLLLPVPMGALLYTFWSSRISASFGAKLSATRKWQLFLVAGAVVLLVMYVALPVLRIRLEALFSPAPLPLTDATLYGILVDELLPLPLSKVFTAEFFLYLPLLYIPLGWCWVSRPASRPPLRLTTVATLLFGAMTICFIRFIYLLMPVLIADLALSAALALDVLLPDSQSTRLARRSAGGLLLVFLPMVVVFTVADLRFLDRVSFEERSGPVACYQWLAGQASPGDVIVADWSHGYELETYTPCRVVMDGYLESTSNRRRITEFYTALYSEDERLLYDFCRRSGARYLMVDSLYLLPYCRSRHLPWPEWFTVEREENKTRITLRPAGTRLNVVKCLFLPERLKSFKPFVFSQNCVILKVLDTTGN